MPLVNSSKETWLQRQTGKEVGWGGELGTEGWEPCPESSLLRWCQFYFDLLKMPSVLGEGHRTCASGTGLSCGGMLRSVSGLEATLDFVSHGNKHG